MPARTIDEVVAKLDEVIAAAKSQESRMGYFPALYRKVTVAVREGIRDGVFEDNERLERLDVVFANRYLDAVEKQMRGEKPTRSWEVSFQAARKWRYIVLQHLLLGMNAHINLDLGVAAAEVAPGAELAGLRKDFEKINDLLAAQVDGVKEELATIWPKLRKLDRLGGSAEDRLINFSIRKARSFAWRLAQELAPLPPDRRRAAIDLTDLFVAKLSGRIRKPGTKARIATTLIRLGEKGTVPEIIDLLL